MPRSSVLLAGAAVFAAAAAPGVAALNNGGVAKLPVMGYNTWNAFQCEIDETLILETAKLMDSLGLKAAGYNYVNIDDCYSEKERNATGYIIEDKTRFKSGMRTLTNQIHDMGFKAGIYSDSGWKTCAGYPGSWSNEAKDAHTFFVDWNFDYLKFDNCNDPDPRVLKLTSYERYTRMANEIAKLDRPVVYSLCSWGLYNVWQWGAQIAQSWRTTWDIEPKWDSLSKIINTNSYITMAADFYGHNDMDMLQVGNGDLTFEEMKAHFTSWALMKSPLFVGTDLRKITNETLTVLTNPEIIAINQDDQYGESIAPFRFNENSPPHENDFTGTRDHPAEYWSGRSKNGTVVMVLNTESSARDMTYTLEESPWVKQGTQYTVRDLWEHKSLGTFSYQVKFKNVPAHGVKALLLAEVGDIPDNAPPDPEVTASSTAASRGPQPTSNAGQNIPSGIRAAVFVTWVLKAVMGSVTVF